MPSDLRFGGWQDLSGESWAGVSNDYGYTDSVMDSMKTVCILPGRCQVNSIIHSAINSAGMPCYAASEEASPLLFYRLPDGLKLIPFVCCFQFVTSVTCQ